MSRRSVRALAAVSALTTVAFAGLAGCRDDSSVPASTASTDASASTASPMTTVAPPRPVSGCPTGRWAVSQQELQGYFNTVGAMTAVSVVVAGDAELRLGTDGRLSFVVDDFRFAQDAGGTRIDLLMDGSIDGVYTVTGSVLTVDALVPDATAAASVDGTEMDVGPVLANFVAQLPFDGASFGCTDDDLTLDVNVLGTPHRLTFQAS